MRPTIGRIVLYSLSLSDVTRGEREGDVRPALIVNDWGGAAEDVDAHPNLKVFLDDGNDNGNDTMLWRTSVAFDPSGKPGTWRWSRSPAAKATSPVVIPQL